MVHIHNSGRDTARNVAPVATVEGAELQPTPSVAAIPGGATFPFQYPITVEAGERYEAEGFPRIVVRARCVVRGEGRTAELPAWDSTE